MANGGGLLDTIGQGLGTGLGTALTPLAMLMAAKGGRDPFSILRAGDDAMRQRQAQEAALAAAQREDIEKRAAGVQTLAVRDYLATHPEAAPAFGLQTAPMGIAAPEYLERAGLGGVPGYQPPNFLTGDLGGVGVPSPGRVLPPSGEISLLPQQLLTPEEAERRQTLSQTRALDQFTSAVEGATGAGGGIGPAGLPISSITQTPTGGSITYAEKEPIEVSTFEINPATGTRYTPADRIGGRPVKITTPPDVRKKVQTFEAFNDRITAFNREYPPEERAAWTGAWNYGGKRAGEVLGTVFPGLKPADQARFDRFKADLAAIRQYVFEQTGKTLTGYEGAFAKPMLPSGTEGGGPTEFEAKMAALQNYFQTSIQSLTERGEVPPAPPPTTTAAAPPTTTATAQPTATTASTLPTAATGTTLPAAPSFSPEALKAARDIAGLGGPKKKVKALGRAVGGPVGPRQLAIVGEQGPELVAGPATVYPMQLAQAAPTPTRMIGAAPGMGGGTQVPVDPNMVKPPRAVGGTLGAATAKPTPQASGGIGVGVGLSEEDKARAKAGGVQIIQKPGGGYAVIRPGQ